MDSISCPIIVIGIIVLITFAFFYCNFERRLSDLEDKKNKSTKIWLITIEWFVTITVVVAILFSCLASIHYAVVFFPRFITIEEHNSYYQNLGVDYWGIIVGFFSFIVAVILGWQIFSSIKEKEELNRLKDTLKEECENRIESLNDKVFKLSLRNNSAISTLSIGTFFEILDFTIMANNGDFKINDNEQLRLKHLQRDILNILRGLTASNEIADCNIQDFKFYAAVAKKINEQWLKEYVRKFFVFGEDDQRLSSREVMELFDEA